MSTVIKTIIKRIIAVLMFPREINNFISYAKTIYKAMNGNPNFPNSGAKLTKLNTDTLALENAESGLHTKPPKNTTDERDAALEKVKNDLRALQPDVQSAADANPAQAEVIVQSSGMKVKKTSIRQKQQDNVKDGKVSGTVLVTATGRGAHEWQMSKDQKEIITLDSTSAANVIVTGLIPGEWWFFRSRKILTKNKKGNWSAWMKILVK